MSQLVSIVMPFFNHSDYIESAILSVLNQSYKNVEIIVINDGSSKEHELKVENILKNYPSVIKYNQENQGPCVAKNFGIDKSSGEIIGFLDSDNEFLPGYIEGAVTAIQNEEVDWFFGDALYFGDKTGIRAQKLKAPEEIFINSPIDNCFFIKKTVIKEVGGFDIYLSKLGLEDWELTVRLITKEIKYKYLEKPLFKYRVISSSRSANEATENKDLIIKYVFEKHHNYLFDNYSRLFFDNIKMKNSTEARVGNKLRKVLRK